MEHALEDLERFIDFPNQPRDVIGNNYDIPSDLQFLSLINNRLRVIENLDSCGELVHLCLRQNFITSASFSSGLHPVANTLIKLDLYENALDGAALTSSLLSEPFLLFPKLKYLDLSFNPIRQMSVVEKDGETVATETIRDGGVLSAFPHLEYLFFAECKMTTIPYLNSLSDLISLELGSNRIRRIENIECLQGLKQLWLGKNKIETIENLNLPSLQSLSLQANRIVTIQGLDKLSALTELYLSENGIETIQGLSTLTNLTILDLDKNNISVIQGLDALTNLEDLWLGRNQISSFEEIKKLTCLPKLDTLRLEHNPVFRDPQYRNKVLADLPHINELDAHRANRTNNPFIQRPSI